MSTSLRPQAKKRISRAGLELIKSFEGLRRKAARLPGGRYVVGYGHIRSAREGAEVDEADAEALLRYDLLPIEAAVNDWAHAPLTQNQFDALASFSFNIGLRTFRRSDVLRRVNEGAFLQAAAALDAWRRVDLDGEPVIVDALVRRRAVEKALFLTPAEGQAPAPSAVLKPKLDTGAAILARTPEQVTAPLDGDRAVALRAEPETHGPTLLALEPPDDSEPTLFDHADQMDLEDDDSVSAAQAASAAVTARLSEILREVPFDDQDDFLTDDDPEDADGQFLQAPPSPPEDDEPHDDDAFPEPDQAALLALAAEPSDADPEEPAPVAADLGDLQPFPADAPLPPVIEPEEQAEFAAVYADEPASVNTGAEPGSSDASALSRPAQGSGNGPWIYLFLAGLAFVIAALVTIFRTPETGADDSSGLGLILGLFGIAGVAGALWGILRPEPEPELEANPDREP